MANNVVQCPNCLKAVPIPDTPKLPDNLNNMCEQWPALCRDVRAVQAQMNDVVKVMAQIPLRSEHVSPSKALLEHWEQCPDCRPKAESLGLIKPDRKEVKEDKRPFYAKPGFGRE